ncbi:MAG: hypothetical protein LWX70_15205 [Sphingobacteriia bacterium]|nr:hypothetical protein [Sphingobacteriia bacterium]
MSDYNWIPGTIIDHERYGEGVISRNKMTSVEVFFARGGKMEFSKNSFQARVVESSDRDVTTIQVDTKELASSIRDVLDQYGLLPAQVSLGEKWKEGTMILQPANPAIKGKDIPIETFFHKIVMLRDRLRVLEQNINSHKVLSDAEKVDLQQYITRIYGSLTTFNILFADKEDYFVGEKSNS